MPQPKRNVKDIAFPVEKDTGPVWQGPSGQGKQGGVTQSMIARYVVCRERSRIQLIEGLRVRDTFNSRIEFGNMWHVMEEAFAKSAHGSTYNPHAWEIPLMEYAQGLGRKYPLQRSEITEWTAKATVLFPHYVEHWNAHPDVKNRTPLLQEEVFDVPYKLPSDRTVRLRGKWDSVDLIDRGIWNQENKTKSTIDYSKISRGLKFDLQTMTYLVALNFYSSNHKWPADIGWKLAPIKGVRYNVIRRPAHKTTDSMLRKLDEDRKAGRIGEWFSRWNVEVSPSDIARFQRVCLDPILENLCDDYEWWNWCVENKPRSVKTPDVFDTKFRRLAYSDHCPRHFIMPFIGYHPIAEGGDTDLDTYLFNGDKSGLVKTDNLFPELQG